MITPSASELEGVVKSWGTWVFGLLLLLASSVTLGH